LANSNVAKAALDHFVRHLAREEAHHGIRANLVSPGMIMTEETVAFIGKDMNSKEE